MTDPHTHPEQEQVERSKRLRKQIESLKKGQPPDHEGKEPADDKGKEQGRSVKEQIREREAEQRKASAR